MADPNHRNKLPKAVAAARDAANDAIKAHKPAAKSGGEDEAAATPDTGATQQPQDTPPPSQSQDVRPQQPAQQPQQPAQQPAPANQATPRGEGQRSLEDELRTANARYESLRGKYNEDTRQLRGQLEELNRHVQQLAQQQQKQQPEPTAEPATTEADMEEFGAEMIDVIRRIAGEAARNAAQQVRDDVEARLATLSESTSSLGSATAQTRYEVFLDKLTARVPYWQQLNTDPGFLAWLDGKEPLQMGTRRRSLTEANESHDLDTVAQFFETYNRLTNGASTPPNGHGPAAPANGAPPSDISRMDAPVTAQGGPPVPASTGQPPVIRESEYKAWVERRRRFPNSKPPEEWQREEREFYAAAADGRMIPDKPRVP